MAEAAGGTAVGIAVICVALVVGAIFLFKSYTKVEATPASFNLALYGQGQLSATLSRKGWAFGTYGPIAGTIEFTVTGSAAVSLGSVPVTVASPTATTTVTGAAPGEGYVTVIGVTADGARPGTGVKVTVRRD